MPAGSPTAKQLWEGEVSFFSLDTNLIQAAGYNFEKGALHQLPKQLPRSMSLQLSEVVLSEIVKHRMEPVHEALRNFTTSSDKLRRLTDLDLSAVDKAFSDLNAEKRADELFRKQVQDYAARCRGGVLEFGGLDPRELFRRYFATQAPFGERADKKSEFPDAASLLRLEKFACDNTTKGLLASGDAGWAAFAEGSEHLYCVKSIEDLAGLF
jgi:hypothetical protein